MKRRFLVPTAVALVLHAILLFGFRRGPVTVTRLDPPDPATKPLPKDAIALDWPPVRDDLETPPAPKGKPDESRPELPEPPTRDPGPAITIPITTPNLRPIDTRAKLSNEPIGVLDGQSLTDRCGPGIIRADWLDNPPRTRTQLAPVYPYEAKVSGRPGEVLVEFIVDEAGRVLDPHVLSSSDPIFEAPTLRAVAKWRFEPGRRNGNVVRFRMAVPVAYALNP